MTETDQALALWVDDDTTVDSVAASDALVNDVNLQYRARRYQLIGEAMRNELPAAIDLEFHRKVMAEIDIAIEPALTDDRQSLANDLKSNWFKSWVASNWFSRPIAGVAVAATVAVITVVLWQPLNQPVEPNSIASREQQKINQLAQQKADASVVNVSSPVKLGRLQSGGMRWKVDSDTPAMQQKLNAYLVNHTEYSNSVQGLIPQARVAGFDTRR